MFPATIPRSSGATGGRGVSKNYRGRPPDGEAGKIEIRRQKKGERWAGIGTKSLLFELLNIDKL